jgi:hypothetical protein
MSKHYEYYSCSECVGVGRATEFIPGPADDFLAINRYIESHDFKYLESHVVKGSDSFLVA